MSHSSAGPPVLCYGEVLWDSLPQGLFLGGAPFNVAAHLGQLGRDAGLVSRVGSDELGREIERRMRARRLDTSLLQWDDELPTGFVGIRLDDRGNPHYEIFSPSAWDNIAWTDSLAGAARDARAIVFGSLSQRREQSRHTLGRLLKHDGHKVFDINIRPPFGSREVVTESLAAATMLKLNTGELETLRGWYGLEGGEPEAMEALARRFSLNAVILTRAGDGASLWERRQVISVRGPDLEVADAVGAGDAFLAMFLHIHLSGGPAGEALKWANALGGWVATMQGATPLHDPQALKQLYNAQRSTPSESN